MPKKGLVDRAVSGLVSDLLAEFRAVGVIGPRQVGKTTLIHDLLPGVTAGSYVTLDDGPTREAAREDPATFVARLPSPAVIDEIQRAPDLMLEIKMRMDRDDTPGQFLIAGSANILTLPTIRDSLPGRVAYVRLWPFSQAELEGTRTNIIDLLFDDAQLQVQPSSEDAVDVASRVVAGGFPVALRLSSSARARYFADYLASVTGRDLPVPGPPRYSQAVAQLLRLLSGRSSSILNRQSLARDLDVDRKTVDHYLRILSDLMLVRLHPAWHTSFSQREIKAPKVYVTDTGLLLSFVGAGANRLEREPAPRNSAYETFAVMELVKFAEWSTAQPGIFHYRQRERREIDAILEHPDGRIVGIEVKSGATVRHDDFRALAYLRDNLGPRFTRGIVLHTGGSTLPFGDRLWAMPISSLWFAGG